MVEPNMSPASTIANGNRFTHSLTLRDLEDEQNDSSVKEVIAQHQVIDLTNASTARVTAYPFVLSFNNLSYSVNVRKRLVLPFLGNVNLGSQGNRNTKLLIDDISGKAREGEIMAIVGASGAGKTTLIDALAGRIEKESLKGSVTLNGEVLESRLLKILSAYVMQDDLLFPMLTVEETLMFSAEFRLPRSFSKQKRQARVQDLIDQLGLRSAAKTMIGDERHRGVSGGERRRVSIGIDIIHDPILLFLDEPTSGLDSTSAFMVVKVLQRIAKSGSIVIMSIHQPSYRILCLLDHLIFLSHGQTVYRETPGTLSQFLAEFGRPIPEKENQSEFALDLIRELEDTPGGISSLVEFNKQWQTMKNPNKACDETSVQLKDAISASIDKGKLVSSGTASNDSDLISSVQTFVNPFWIEIIVISRRLFTNSRRMPEQFAVRLGIILVTGFILASLYWQLDDSPEGTEERLGFLAFALTTTLFSCTREIPAFLEERNIFIRETDYNAYRHSSYVLAQSLVSIPSMIILSFVFAATVFWAVGLAGGFSGFFFFIITIFATFWSGSSFTALIAGLFPNFLLAITIVIAILSYFLLFCGFYIPRDQIPSYWIWFHYISLVKYPFQGVLQNEYRDSTKCFQTGMQIFDHTPFSGLSSSMKIKILESMNTAMGTNITSSTCLNTGRKILEQKGVTDISKWNCIFIIVAFGFLFRILFYFALLFGRKNNRR